VPRRRQLRAGIRMRWAGDAGAHLHPQAGSHTNLRALQPRGGEVGGPPEVAASPPTG
jgi:hypothetical protein